MTPFPVVFNEWDSAAGHHTASVSVPGGLAVKRAIADSQHSAYSLCLASFLTCHSDPSSLLDLSPASSVGSTIDSICAPQLSNAHACAWDSMCLSIMRFKMGKLILGKWQVCLSRWEGMTFLPRATSSPPNSPTKEYFNRRLMEGICRTKRKRCHHYSMLYSNRGQLSRIFPPIHP